MIIQKGQRIVIPEISWMEKDGRQYFYIRALEATWPTDCAKYVYVVGCDAEGKELVQLDMADHSYRYFE